MITRGNVRFARVFTLTTMLAIAISLVAIPQASARFGGGGGGGRFGGGGGGDSTALAVAEAAEVGTALAVEGAQLRWWRGRRL